MKYFLILILLFPLVVLASGTDIEQEVEVGDVMLDGGTSKALGLGRSSFDVDINQCMGSTAWDTIIGGKQKLVLNWVCLAEFYIKNGQPKLAAVAICNTEMLSEFASEAECETAHDFLADIVPPAPPPPPANAAHEEEAEQYHYEQAQAQVDYDDRLDRIEQRLNRPRPAPEQKPLLTEDQKARLQAIDR